MQDAQIPSTTRPPRRPSSQDLAQPSSKLINPSATNEHSTHNIHEPNHKCQKVAPSLAYYQQYRLDVVFEEYARDDLRTNFATLARGCVLVCEDASSVDAHLHIGAVVDDTILATFGIWRHIEGRWLGDRSGIEGAGLGCGQAAACEDRGDDGEVVLELVKIFVSGG